MGIHNRHAELVGDVHFELGPFGVFSPGEQSDTTATHQLNDVQAQEVRPLIAVMVYSSGVTQTVPASTRNFLQC